MTGGSSAATPSIDSHRLKTRSTRARRSLSIHFASVCTGSRTISLPSLASAASMASTVPVISWLCGGCARAVEEDADLHARISRRAMPCRSAAATRHAPIKSS